MIKLGNDTKSQSIKGMISDIDGLREDVNTVNLKFSGYSDADKLAIAKEIIQADEGETLTDEEKVASLQALINSFASWKNAINGVSCAYVSDLVYMSTNVR